MCHKNFLGFRFFSNLIFIGLFFLCISQAKAVFIKSIAGDSFSGYKDGIRVLNKFSFPSDLVEDSLGNIFVTDENNEVIRKILPSGKVVTFAGKEGEKEILDGLGSAARFNQLRAGQP